MYHHVVHYHVHRHRRHHRQHSDDLVVAYYHYSGVSCYEYDRLSHHGHHYEIATTDWVEVVHDEKVVVDNGTVGVGDVHIPVVEEDGLRSVRHRIVHQMQVGADSTVVDKRIHQNDVVAVDSTDDNNVAVVAYNIHDIQAVEVHSEVQVDWDRTVVGHRYCEDILPVYLDHYRVEVVVGGNNNDVPVVQYALEVLADPYHPVAK